MSEASPSRKRILTRSVILLLAITVPIAVHQIYHSLTDLPRTVRIVRGVEGGRFRPIGDAIGRDLKEATGINVEFVNSAGSLESLQLLESGRADFALFQTEMTRFRPTVSPRIQCVGNVFSEVVHILVRNRSDITDARQLKKHRVSVGAQKSGDFATSLPVLNHLGLFPDEALAAMQREDAVPKGDAESLLESAASRLGSAGLEPVFLDYPTVESEFLRASEEPTGNPLEAALVTMGPDAPFLKRVMGSGKVRIVSIPFTSALATRHPSFSPHKIPAGLYATSPQPIPAEDIDTVAVQAQLLTRDDVPANLVEAVTRVVMNKQFQQRNRLQELQAGGRAYALSDPGFPIHVGSSQFFDPDLKPLLPTDFVEATEGLRSFLVSMVIAVWLFLRWFKDNRTRSREHRLDRFIRDVLAIERRQMDFDQETNSDDIENLQNLLDEVTELRQEALSELTAHELKQHSAADSFIQLCYALSEKINAKLTRQRLEQRLSAIEERLSNDCGTSGADSDLSDAPSH